MVIVFTQDNLILKPQKKSSLLLRIIVLVCAMLLGVYICSMHLKRISTGMKNEVLDVQVVKTQCLAPHVEPWENKFVHYPDPETFRRYDRRVIGMVDLTFCLINGC